MLSSFHFFFPSHFFFLSKSGQNELRLIGGSLRALKSGWGKSPCVTVAVCTAVCVGTLRCSCGCHWTTPVMAKGACGLCCLLCQTLPELSHMCHTVLQVPAFISRPSIALPTLFGHPSCFTLFHTPCQPWQLLG